MGGCFSGHIPGGMEAVRDSGRSRGAAHAGGPNGVVNHFFRASLSGCFSGDV
jgi:hypothetical protein